MLKEKTIFTRRMALYLRQNGFSIIRTEPNRQKPEFDVYIFNDTPQLQQAITEYTRSK